MVAVLLALTIAGPDDLPAGPVKPAGPAVKEPKLREELLARMKEEQDARFALIKAGAMGKKEPGKDDTAGAKHPAMRKVKDLDAANRTWLKGVIEKHGWPGKSLVGAEGTHAAWLLVQHADADRPFQKKCLELLKGAVTAGESSAADLAYLTDRVLVSEGKKQIYGTQLSFQDGKLVPGPIEDERNVDARRKDLGLQPLAEYVEFAAKMYAPRQAGKPAAEKK